jgi:uncharacterized DUF497 family protein
MGFESTDVKGFFLAREISSITGRVPEGAVTFDEALTVFGDPLSLTIPDPGSRAFERRFAQVGHSSRGRLLVVIHADRGDTIRLISARPATRAERTTYEEGT